MGVLTTIGEGPANAFGMFWEVWWALVLGIVLWIFLGPAFTATEFVGGFALILMMWAGVRLLVSEREEGEIREHAQEAQTS